MKGKVDNRSCKGINSSANFLRFLCFAGNKIVAHRNVNFRSAPLISPRLQQQCMRYVNQIYFLVTILFQTWWSEVLAAENSVCAVFFGARRELKFLPRQNCERVTSMITFAFIGKRPGSLKNECWESIICWKDWISFWNFHRRLFIESRPRIRDTFDNECQTYDVNILFGIRESR